MKKISITNTMTYDQKAQIISYNLLVDELNKEIINLVRKMHINEASNDLNIIKAKNSFLSDALTSDLGILYDCSGPFIDEEQ